MGIYTAQILIGCGKMYDKGINPSHALFLHEDDQDVAWVLKKLDLQTDQTSASAQSAMQWTCSLDNLLDDAMLLIAIYVLKDDVTITLTKELTKSENLDKLNLKNDISSEDRQILYDLVMSISAEYTLTVTAFDFSLLKWQLSSLENYSAEKHIFLQQDQKQTISEQA